MGVKLEILGTFYMAAFLFLICLGCVSDMKDTVDPYPPLEGQSITSDQGYRAIWDDGTINDNLPEACVTPN